MWKCFFYDKFKSGFFIWNLEKNWGINMFNIILVMVCVFIGLIIGYVVILMKMKLLKEVVELIFLNVE